MLNSERPPLNLECEINGKRTAYDACSANSLEKAKEFYAENAYVKWDYIGSSNKYFANGVEQNSKKLLHFFTKVSKREIPAARPSLSQPPDEI